MEYYEEKIDSFVKGYESKLEKDYIQPSSDEDYF